MRDTVQLVRAQVSAAAPLTVLLDGSSTAAPAQTLTGYAPVAADRVLVAVVGSGLIILGKVSP